MGKRSNAKPGGGGGAAQQQQRHASQQQQPQPPTTTTTAPTALRALNIGAVVAVVVAVVAAVVVALTAASREGTTTTTTTTTTLTTTKNTTTSQPQSKAELSITFNTNGNRRLANATERVTPDSFEARLRRDRLKAWNDDGRRVRTFKDAADSPRAEDGSTHLWVSPDRPNLHFIWPATPRVRTVRNADGDTFELTLVSEFPRVFLVSGFVRPNEADELVRTALDPNNPYSMRPSTTGSEAWTKDQKTAHSRDRTSDNAFDVSSPLARTIQLRGFELLRFNPARIDMFDGLQIVRYQTEQAYAPHADNFPPSHRAASAYDFDSTRATGGNRFATLFLYIRAPESGGQTAFPLVPMSDVNAETRRVNATLFGDSEPFPADDVQRAFKTDAKSWERNLLKTVCYGGAKLSVRPQAGAALLFYSLRGDGSVDPKAVHAACPVVRGTKFGANFWLWNQCRYGETTCLVPVGVPDPLM